MARSIKPFYAKLVLTHLLRQLRSALRDPRNKESIYFEVPRDVAEELVLSLRLADEGIDALQSKAASQAAQQPS